MRYQVRPDLSPRWGGLGLVSHPTRTRTQAALGGHCQVVEQAPDPAPSLATRKAPSLHEGDDRVRQIDGK